MKAAEVLRLYEAGRRDFRGEDLRGQRFRGQNLAGADFSGADIRSANFSGATLTRACFSEAKAGLQRSWALCLMLFLCLVAVVSGGFAGIIGYLITVLFTWGDRADQITILLVPLTTCIFVVRKGLSAAVVRIANTIAVAIAALYAVKLVRAAIDSERSAEDSFSLAMGFATGVSIFAAIAAVCALIYAFTVAVTYARAVAVAGEYAGTITYAFALAVPFRAVVATKAAIAWADGGNADLFPVDNGTVSLVSLAIAVLLTIASVHAGYCALRGDSRDAWIRLNAVAFATTGGTRFYGADLTNADFTGTPLRGADFRRAILTEVDWRNASGIDWAR